MFVVLKNTGKDLLVSLLEISEDIEELEFGFQEDSFEKHEGETYCTDGDNLLKLVGEPIVMSYSKVSHITFFGDEAEPENAVEGMIIDEVM